MKKKTNSLPQFNFNNVTQNAIYRAYCMILEFLKEETDKDVEKFYHMYYELEKILILLPEDLTIVLESFVFQYVEPLSWNESDLGDEESAYYYTDIDVEEKFVEFAARHMKPYFIGEN